MVSFALNQGLEIKDIELYIRIWESNGLRVAIGADALIKKRTRWVKEHIYMYNYGCEIITFRQANKLKYKDYTKNKLLELVKKAPIRIGLECVDIKPKDIINKYKLSEERQQELKQMMIKHFLSPNVDALLMVI